MDIDVTIEETQPIDVTIQGGIGVRTFSALVDTPGSYDGQANKILQVKSTEDGLEFTDSPTIVDWDEIGGDQTDINLSGFTNDLNSDDIPEGEVNLYFTDQRGQDSVGNILSNEFTYHEGISLNYENISHASIQDIGTNTHESIDSHIEDATIHFSDLSGFTTDNLTEGLNLYYTEARVSANEDVSANTLNRHNHTNKTNLDSIDQDLSTTDNVTFNSVNATLNGVDNTKISKFYQPDETNPFVYTDNAGTLHIDGDITQQGEAYETHAEQLYTTKDFIKTRDGAIAGLSTGEISGIEVLKYDGLNNLTFGTDSDGYFKVGEPGDLQILATREDNPTNGGITYFNDTLKRLDTNSTFVYNAGNVGIGTTAPSQKLDVAGNINIDGTSAYLYEGHNAIKLATKGDTVTYSSTIIGRAAGDTKTDGTTIKQTALGYAAGSSNSGSYQTALGMNAGSSNSGSYQTAVGYLAGYQNTGTYQTALGMNAGYSNTGHRVTGVGYEATRGNLVDDVVAIGYQAGKDNALANQFIVKQASINAVPLIQGDFATGNVGIGMTSPSQKLDVAGGLRIDNDSWISARDYSGAGVVNLFKVNEDNEIDVGGTLNIGTLSLSEDSGAVTLVNMPVSATPTAGDEMSYSFSIDSDVIAKVYAEADGSGGIQNQELKVSAPVSSTQYKLSALNTAPSSASDTGTTGEIRITATAIYVCTATDTWVKADLATW